MSSTRFSRAARIRSGLNAAGLTALQQFVRVGPDQGDTAGMLVDAGADPGRAYPNGDAPLHATIRSGGSRGKVEVAEALLAGGADPCVRGRSAATSPITSLARVGRSTGRWPRAGGYDLACDDKEGQRIEETDRAVNGGVIMRQIGGVKMHHGLGGSLSA